MFANLAAYGNVRFSATAPGFASLAAKPPQGQKKPGARSRPENRFLSACRVKEKCRSGLNPSSSPRVYMQARYYDPKIGRFLSVDPVTFSPNKPQFFNRYWYAQGNPYKYTDPDGRCAICVAMAVGALIGGSINLGAQLINGQGSFSNRVSNVNWKQVGVAAAAGALGGGAGVVASTAATTGGAIAANAVAGAAIGAGAAHASAAVEGKTASVSDVVTGAVTGGALSGAAGAIGAAGKAISKAASASMTGTQKVANGNLLRGVADTTRSGGGTPDFAAPGTGAAQGAANAVAEVVNNASNVQAQPKHDLQNQ